MTSLKVGDIVKLTTLPFDYYSDALSDSEKARRLKALYWQEMEVLEVRVPTREELRRRTCLKEGETIAVVKTLSKNGGMLDIHRKWIVRPDGALSLTNPTLRGSTPLTPGLRDFYLIT